MENSNTVPHALSMSLDEERQAFANYLATPDGGYLASAIECGKYDLSDVDLEVEVWLHDKEASAADIIDRANDTIDKLEGLKRNLGEFRDGYVKSMAIAEAIDETVLKIEYRPSKQLLNALRYGFDLHHGSTKKLAKDLRASLIALGLPKDKRGLALHTYHRASCWTDELAHNGDSNA